jgi:hypothetical protein
MQSKEKLTTLCGFSREEATLDVSNQGLGPGDAVLIANDISDMGALSYLNLADNNLGALVPPDSEGWIVENNIFYGPNDEEQEDPPPGSSPAGIIVVANAIKDMGALSVLSLKMNGLGTKEAGMVLGGMLKVNSVLKELDLSDNRPFIGDDPVGFAQGLAAGIKDNGAMSSLNLTHNRLGAKGATNITTAVEVRTIYTSDWDRLA